MATSYRYQLFDSEFGPVSFKELVALVRDGSLGTDDFVQPDWSTDWQPAATVVGLFHMAGRQDVLLAWEREHAAQLQLAGQQQFVEEQDVAPEEPGWQKRLREVEEKQRISAALEREERRIVAMAEQEAQLKSQTIAAALAEAEQRDEVLARQQGNGWKSIGKILNLKTGFRWAVAIVTANLAAWGISNWSALQLQRYPDLKLIESGTKVFPLMGACTGSEFQFLLVDAMLLAGILAYFGAGLLTAVAED